MECQFILEHQNPKAFLRARACERERERDLNLSILTAQHQEIKLTTYLGILGLSHEAEQKLQLQHLQQLKS